MTSVHRLGLLSSLLLAAFLCYSPGLSGPFVFDDGPNILENGHIQIEKLSPYTLYKAAFSTRTGPLYRPISMLTVALNYYWWGEDAWFYKLFNIIVHCFSIAAVFYFIFYMQRAAILARPHCFPHQTLQQQWWIAFVVASLWGLHPLNLTSVLYVIQRMASLSGLFTFLSLTFYLRGRIAILDSQRRVWVWWLCSVFFAVLGIFSKENALLLPFFIALLEACLLHWKAPDKNWSRFFHYARGVCFFGIAAVGVSIFYWWSELALEYRYRTFTLAERLLTEPRVLWHYLSWSFLPDIRAMGLFHDDIVLSQTLINPITTLFSLVGIVSILVVAWRLLTKQPMMGFAIFWFFVAHLMESTVIPLEIVHEHRNYVALVGPILITVLIFRSVSARFNIRFPVRAVLIAALAIALMSQTYARAFSWGMYHRLIELELENHPQSTRIRYEYGRVMYAYLTSSGKDEDREKYYLRAKASFEQVYLEDRLDLGALPALIRLQLLMKRPINKYWVDELAQRLVNHSLGPAKIRQVFDLAVCKLNGSCNLPYSMIERLLSAALDNKYEIRPSLRSSTLNLLGVLKWEQGQYAQAASYFKEAYLVERNEVFIASTINAYIESGDTSKAINFATNVVGMTEAQLFELGFKRD